ncbi:MAG: hypothetical protein MUF25_29220 [Pirellulaceae bacterium]|nr:hypothetical protein [Pirellulaceae bacterium]
MRQLLLPLQPSGLAVQDHQADLAVEFRDGIKPAFQRQGRSQEKRARQLGLILAVVAADDPLCRTLPRQTQRYQLIARPERSGLAQSHAALSDDHLPRRVGQAGGKA